MSITELDKALQLIIAKRNELRLVDYANPKYDDLEEQLHDLEDDFQDTFGEYLEDILQGVHDKLCPDTEVLFPIAYVAKSYAVNGNNEFSVAAEEGVFVEVDEHPGKETKLVLIPSPLRVVLNVGKEKQEVVWTAS